MCIAFHDFSQAYTPRSVEFPQGSATVTALQPFPITHSTSSPSTSVCQSPYICDQVFSVCHHPPAAGKSFPTRTEVKALYP
jgi:hypothetical protein